MKKTKSIWRMYPAWAFDREVRDLEEQSKKGWHLVKGGLFHCSFAFDDSVQYRYALDFNQDITDPVRYREIFREQGWEFINSTFNGWHYFRKSYDPALPEEEYQIYTDTASRQEMADRWRRLARILGSLELAVGALNLVMNLRHPAIYSICLGLGCMLLGLLLLTSAKWIGCTDRRRTYGWLFVPVMALFLIALVYGGFRTSGFTTQTEYAAPETEDAWTFSLPGPVKLPDLYTLDIYVDAPAKATVCLVKEGSNGGVVYAVSGNAIEERARLFLMPGSYYVSTQYDQGTEPGLTGQFNYELN